MTDAPQREIDMRYVEPATARFREHMIREVRALPGDQRRSLFNAVTHEFFEILNIPLRRGRYLTERDVEGSPWVAVVNEAFAREYFPNQDALGQTVTISAGLDERPRENVGVVADHIQFTARIPVEPEIYTSHLQQTREIPGNFQGVRFRSKLLIQARPDSVPRMEQLSRITANFDRDLPVIESRPLDWHIGMRIGPMRFYSKMLLLFSVIALLLAIIGIYGLVSYSVTGRFHEIGIRLSLGATGKEIVWLVTSYGLRLTAVGLVMGTAGALATTRLIANVLFDIKPWDPATFVLVAAVLGSVAITASVVPAWKALSIDAVTASAKNRNFSPP